MLSVLVLLTSMASVDAVGSITQCPESCHCEPTYPDSQLSIDCSQRLSDVDEEQLYHQLDSMLSADHFVEHLTALTITNTPLTRVPASVCKLLNLGYLNLDRNKLTELPDNCFTKLTKLVTLRAKRNAINGLQDGLFEGLQSLNILDLQCNHIAFIGLRVFSNSSDLISLRQIILAGNRLTSLEPWPYYRFTAGDKRHPATIYLHSNWISNFTNKLNFRFRCGMNPICGRLFLDYNRIKHIMDMVNGWNIGGDNVFSALFCLYTHNGHDRCLSVSLATEQNTGGSYECDCTDFPIYKLVKFSPRNRILDGVVCNSAEFYSTGGQLMYANAVPLNEFICEQPDRCPSSCRRVYRPANATLHVYCSAAN